MANYLLDTNVLLRVANFSDVSHQLASDATAYLQAGGSVSFLTAQVLIEFWCVATRPLANNGLGWDPVNVDIAVQSPRSEFPLLDDMPDIFPLWRNLTVAHGVRGKQVHDARLVAVMQFHGVDHILTFNVSDFRRFTGIVAVHPTELVSALP
jgi:predicted nucleic acid-binding protein